MGSHGPGEAIVTRFEKDSGAKVTVTALGDAGLMLERLKLQPQNFDVVLGLDILALDRAVAEFKWTPLPDSTEGWSEDARAMSLPEYSPIAWSPLTFIYREDGQPVPRNFDELKDPRFYRQLTLEDPHTSAPGAQFLAWTQALGKDLDWLKALRLNVLDVAPTWTFAYGRFEKRQTRFVFSYLTSLSYHWGLGQDRSYRALSFAEGHPRAVDYVAVPADAPHAALAQGFIRALHQEWAQTLIMQKNFLFPVIQKLTVGTVFAELPKLKTITVPTHRDLKDWDHVFAP